MPPEITSGHHMVFANTNVFIFLLLLPSSLIQCLGLFCVQCRIVQTNIMCVFAKKRCPCKICFTSHIHAIDRYFTPVKVSALPRYEWESIWAILNYKKFNSTQFALRISVTFHENGDLNSIERVILNLQGWQALLVIKKDWNNPLQRW